MNRLQLTYRDLPSYSLAAQQNAYRLFSHARLTYPKDEQAVASPTLRNLIVRLECADNLLRPETWNVAEISPGQSVALQDRSFQFSHDYLLRLTDENRIRCDLTVVSSDNPDERLVAQTETLTVFPANFWGGEARQPELLVV